MLRRLRIFHCGLVTKRRIKRLFFYFCCFIFLSVTFHTRSHQSTQIKNYSQKSWNFSLLLPSIEPEISNHEDVILVVVVNSDATGAQHRQLRATIRQTWGNSSAVENAPKHQKWKLFFSLGVSDNSTEHQLNLEEASKTKDVMIGNFTDSYYHLLTKTLMSHYWAISKITSRYILKTDDDVYVRIPKLINWLQSAGSPQPFYGGFLNPYLKVSRNPTSKWFITREQYSEEEWPPLCYGAYHVLSSDVVPKIIHYTTIRKTHHVDDAFIAVALKHYGINATQIPQFNFLSPFQERTECELRNAIALAHQLNSSVMLKYHEFYKMDTIPYVTQECPVTMVTSSAKIHDSRFTTSLISLVFFLTYVSVN